MTDPETLDSVFEENPQLIRRRKRIPLYIKVFIWFFMLAGILVPAAVLNNILNPNWDAILGIYGFHTTKPLSWMGLMIVVIYMFKAVVAWALWTENKWALRAAQWDGLLGGLICVAVMVLPYIYPASFNYSLRLEILLIIPYYRWAKRHQRHWEATPESQT